MAYADAATVLDIPIGTLMSRLGRGRAALRAFEARGEAAQEPPPAPKSSRPDTPRLRLVMPPSDEDGRANKWAAGEK